MATALDRLAGGDTSVQVNVRSRDEIGRVAQAFQTFRQKTEELKRLEEQRAQDQARQEQEKRQRMMALADNFESAGGGGNQIGENANGIAAAVEEQNASTQEIARNVQQAAAGTRQVTPSVNAVRQAADQSGASAAEVLDAAGEPAKQSERMCSEVGQFFAGLRQVEA